MALDTGRTSAALLYHHVGPLAEIRCRGLNVTASAFASQVRTLSALGFESILVSDWIAYTERQAGIPDRPLIITFDDAYASLTDHALPVLERYGFSATVYVPTALVGRTIVCDPGHSDATLAVMTPDDIRAWAARGFEFGAHTQTHADLSLLGEQAAMREINGSCQDLEAILGRPVTSFAYPYGRANAGTERAVRARFSCAFSIDEGLNDATTPAWRLRRTMVQHADSVADVCLRARFGRSALADARTAARRAMRFPPRSPLL
jgi:peptidoglycan/xylan/chitin deacetylase (PgdA/CDA1 family)